MMYMRPGLTLQPSTNLRRSIYQYIVKIKIYQCEEGVFVAYCFPINLKIAIFAIIIKYINFFTNNCSIARQC